MVMVYMIERKPVVLLYILVFIAFSNISVFTVEKLGIPAMPVIYSLALAIILLDLLTSEPYPLKNYQNPNSYIIILFFLLYITIGFINTNISEAVFAVYDLLVGFAIYNLILLYVNRKEELEGMMLVMMLSAPFIMLQGAFGLITDLSRMGTDTTLRVGGWWGDPNYYAIVICFSYLASIYFMRKDSKLLRWLAYFVQLSAAAGVFLSLSRSGIIFLIAITLMHWRSFWRRKSFIIAMVALGLLISMVFSIYTSDITGLEKFELQRLSIFQGQNESDITNGRLDAAVGGLLIYLEHPAVGAGFGNILQTADRLNSLKLHTHNMFLEILAVSGPLPFFGYVFMLVYLYFSMRKTKKGPGSLGDVFSTIPIILAIMGLFAHYLLSIKPVWIILACIPVYSQLKAGELHAYSDDSG